MYRRTTIHLLTDVQNHICLSCAAKASILSNVIASRLSRQSRTISTQKHHSTDESKDQLKNHIARLEVELRQIRKSMQESGSKDSGRASHKDSKEVRIPKARAEAEKNGLDVSISKDHLSDPKSIEHKIQKEPPKLAEHSKQLSNVTSQLRKELQVELERFIQDKLEALGIESPVAGMFISMLETTERTDVVANVRGTIVNTTTDAEGESVEASHARHEKEPDSAKQVPEVLTIRKYRQKPAATESVTKTKGQASELNDEKRDKKQKPRIIGVNPRIIGQDPKHPELESKTDEAVQKADHRAKAPLKKKVSSSGAKPVPSIEQGNAKKKLTKSPGKKEEIHSLSSEGVELVPIPTEQPPVPRLAYGLDRVLFNSGVYQVQDRRTKVFNFDPYLETIMPVAEFNFDSLKEYVTSSKDDALSKVAKEADKKYTGSTSSMTGILSHFHYLISEWRPLNFDMLSKSFDAEYQNFTIIQRAPSAIFLKWKGGNYAIDADKELASANILSMLGKSMEKLLTLDTDEFERYRKSSTNKISEEEKEAPEAFHFSTMGDFLMRSQLDAYDPRLPGTGMFDLKTRAVVSIRMNVKDYETLRGYEITDRLGHFESFEREYYDMIRAAFLKYSLQVRMGRMDGIFVAYHNTERIFGFQYLPLEEMDAAIHGQSDRGIGNEEFKYSVMLLNKVLDRATKEFPEQSIRLHFETRDTKVPFMYIFAEPVIQDEMDTIQSSREEEIRAFERKLLGMEEDLEAEKPESAWDDIRESVDQSMEEEESGEYEIVESLQPADEPDDSDVTSEAESDVEHSESDLDVDMTSQEAVNYLANEEPKIHEANLQSVSSASSSEDAGSIVSDKNNERTGFSRTVVENEESSANIDSNAETLVQIEEPLSNVALDDNLSRSPKGKTIQDFFARESSRNGEVTIGEALKDPSSVLVSQDLQDDEMTAKGDNKSTRITDGEEEADKDEPHRKPKEILAMILTIRNKVDDAYVKRPTASPTTTRPWTMEYVIRDVDSQDQARNLYKMCKARRRKALVEAAKSGQDDSALSPEEQQALKYKQPYLRMLRDLSLKRRRMRRKEDHEENGREPVVYGMPMAGEGESEEGRREESASQAG